MTTTKSFTTLENAVPMYLDQGSTVTIYYANEFMTVEKEPANKEPFNKDKMTELIYFITDIALSKTAIKIKNKNNELTSVHLFQRNNILKFITDFDADDRREMIQQIIPDKVAQALKHFNHTPKSRTISSAYKQA